MQIVSLFEYRSSSGFALVTELITLVIFGFSILALSNLSGRTIVASSESLQRIHATWLANSLVARLAMNKTQAQALEYQRANVNCDGAAGNRSQADLQALFCDPDSALQSKSIQTMGNFDWRLSCVDQDTTDAIACSNGSLYTLEFSWLNQDNNPQDDNVALSYQFFL